MKAKEIIVAHDVADFDAVAASVAASRLYPDAVLVRRRLEAPTVRAFLALHRDRFSFVNHSDIDQDAVQRWVIVDVRRTSRLGDFDTLLKRSRNPADPLEVHVYDHHAAESDDLRGAREWVEPVGAVTTLIVERLIERGIDVDPLEATLYALGIYTDTGSLSYAGTTPRDVRAAAWLLERGASLAMLNRYLRPTLSDRQREVLAQVLGNVQTHRIGSVEIGISVVTMDKSIGGLALVTSEACKLGQASALFAVYAISGKKVQVVARTRRSVVDVSEVLSRFGGGGHEDAASATIRKVGGEEIRDAILEALRADPPRPRRVRELMSSPVRTVEADVLLQDIGRSLGEWRHTGVPVMRGGRLSGILSRRDIERATQAGKLHLRCSSHMSSPVRTIGPDASLEDAMALMSAKDLGRLPVVTPEGAMVGIISRSDILRAMYGDDTKTHHE